MHTGLEDRVRDFPKLAAYFAERARGGVGLMVTGGFAPNIEGWLTPFGSRLASRRQAASHRIVTDAVHAEGTEFQGNRTYGTDTGAVYYATVRYSPAHCLGF